MWTKKKKTRSCSFWSVPKNRPPAAYSRNKTRMLSVASGTHNLVERCTFTDRLLNASLTTDIIWIAKFSVSHRRFYAFIRFDARPNHQFHGHYNCSMNKMLSNYLPCEFNWTKEKAPDVWQSTTGDFIRASIATTATYRKWTEIGYDEVFIVACWRPIRMLTAYISIMVTAEVTIDRPHELRAKRLDGIAARAAHTTEGNTFIFPIYRPCSSALCLYVKSLLLAHTVIHKTHAITLNLILSIHVPIFLPSFPANFYFFVELDKILNNKEKWMKENHMSSALTEKKIVRLAYILFYCSLCVCVCMPIRFPNMR